MATKTVIEQLIIEIAGDSRKFKATVKDIKKQNKDLEGSYKKLATAGKFAFAAIGSAAVLLGTVATKAFAEFETGVTNVAKTTNLAGKDLEDFKDEIIKMSERIPVTTSKLLEIATAAGQLGIKGTANLSKFTEVIAKLGATTDLEGEQAALAIARILNLTNESIQSVDKLGSTLVELGNNFAASESEILEVSKDVAKAVVNFDLASDEILGISAAMASLGIAAEAGGTVVGKAFQSIDQAIRSQAGPAFDKLVELTGMTGDQLEQTFATDASAVFTAFIQGLGKAKESGKDLTAEMGELGLSGIRVNKILPTLAGRADILADAMLTAGEASQDASALNEEAGKAFATTTNQLIIAQTKLNNVLIATGKDIAPETVTALTTIADAVSQSTPLWLAMGKGVNFFLKGISNIVRTFSALAEIFPFNLQDHIKNLKNQAKQQDDWLKDQVRKRGITAATFRKKQRQNRRAAAKEELKDVKKGAKDISKAEKAATDKKLKAVEAENMRKAEIEAAANDEEFAEIEAFTDEVVEEYRDSQDKILAGAATFNEQFVEISKAGFDSLTDMQKGEYAKQLQQIKDNEKSIGEIEADAVIDREKKRVEAHNRRLKDEKEFGATMAAIKEIQRSTEFTATKTAADSLAVLINSENNELKAIGKAATIVQIGMSTAEGALKAFTSLAWIPYVGPVLGGIAAASLVAYGGEQISKVAGMKTGGIVPGSGSGDIVPTMLEPGELVVPKDVTSDIMKRMGARGMREGGVVGDKEKTGLNDTFDDIFGIPGIFKSILGMDGGDSDTSASGFGAQAFNGMADAMADPLEAAANEMLRVFLSAIPGGDVIYEAVRATQRPKEELEKLLGDNALADLLDQFDLSDEVEDAIIRAGGGVIETGKDLIGGATGIIDDFRDSLPGFQKGGIVPGSGSGDSVAAMLTPGELVIPKSFASSFGGSISGSSGGPGGGGVQTVHNTFEFALKDDLIDFVSVGLRQKEIEGT